MAMKACSTFVASFALVSMKGIPISSAKALGVYQNSYQKSKMTTKLERERESPYLCGFIWNGSVFSKITLVSN